MPTSGVGGFKLNNVRGSLGKKIYAEQASVGGLGRFVSASARLECLPELNFVCTFPPPEHHRHSFSCSAESGPFSKRATPSLEKSKNISMFVIGSSAAFIVLCVACLKSEYRTAWTLFDLTIHYTRF